MLGTERRSGKECEFLLVICEIDVIRLNYSGRL